jgi:hypothetical protein
MTARNPASELSAAARAGTWDMSRLAGLYGRCALGPADRIGVRRSSVTTICFGSKSFEDERIVNPIQFLAVAEEPEIGAMRRPKL